MRNSEAAAVAARTADAFSFHRYGAHQWAHAIRLLAEAGLSGSQIEEVMRSKIPRMAADVEGRATATNLLKYCQGRSGRRELRDLGIGGFEAAAKAPTSGADLAGFCEGEDIADLIDFARQVRDETASSGEAGSDTRQLAILRDKASRILDAINARVL